jgi:ATP-dependent exoDNAse (exonuclease V) beta subunit
MQEAVEAFNDEQLNQIFNPDPEHKTYDEMPLMYTKKDHAIYGIVDRVIRSEHDVTVIDYKSHPLDEKEAALEAAQQYSKQLNYYREGIRLLWPDLKVKTGVLFTQAKAIVWL